MAGNLAHKLANKVHPLSQHNEVKAQVSKAKSERTANSVGIVKNLTKR